MFDRPTVIVLGAGASAQFGFPLGQALYDDLVSGIDGFERDFESQAFPQLPTVGVHNAPEFQQHPFKILASYLASPYADKYLPEDISRDQTTNLLFAFGRDLKRSTLDTIDRFIRDNPGRNFMGKVLISQQILRHMYERDKQEFHLKSFGERTYGRRRNWYHLLINLIREGTASGEALRDNKLCIITFNYDLSLERALEASLADTELHQGADYRQAVDILHVNGAISEPPNVVTDFGIEILKSARNFHLVDENTDSELAEIREKAQQAISNADRIYVMGFHFDPSNVSTIGLQEIQGKRPVFCLNFDGHLGLRQRMSRLRIQKGFISSGSEASPVHIHQALENGFLEQ